MKKRVKPFRLPGWGIILLDLAAIGIGLCLFSLFHHVLPTALSEGQSVPEPDEIADFSAAFPGIFTEDGSVIRSEGENESLYADGDMRITLTTRREGNAVYHLADVYVRRVTLIQSAFASGQYGKSITDSTLNMARENNAVLAVSGDYYGIRDRSVVIRNGFVYRTAKAHQICVLYYSGEMKTYSYAQFNVTEAIRGGAWQAWDFGPALLDGGKAVTEFDTGIAGANPRCAIGYYEPGHYCFVAVDGRQSSSEGMTLPQLAALFEKLGCQSAYNLDGGHSAVMTWDGEICNSPSKKGGRDISDIIYLAPASKEEE